MLTSRAKWVLFEIAIAGGERSARAMAQAKIDPLLRAAVRKRVAVMYADGESLTRVSDVAHVAKLAWLHAEQAPVIDPDDVAAVSTLFADQAPRAKEPPARAPSLALGAVVIASSLMLSGALVWSLWPKRDLHPRAERTEAAFVEGGRPEESGAAVRAIFTDALPLWVAALQGRGDLDAAREALMQESERALGAEITSYLRAVVAQSEEQVRTRLLAAQSHLAAVEAFNASLRRAGIGYYVDAEVYGQHGATNAIRFSLASFEVLEVTPYEALGDTEAGEESETVRALVIRRVDPHGQPLGLLGFTRPYITDALVLEERIEEFLVDPVLPSAAPNARLSLFDEDTREAPYAVAVETVAAEDVRNELARLALGVNELRALAEPLQTRLELVRGWKTTLARTGTTIVLPGAYDMDVSRYAGLRGQVLNGEWAAFERAQDALDQDAVRATYATLARAYRRSIEQHEVQHRLDFIRGPLPMPEALVTLTGPRMRGQAGDQQENKRAITAVRELSAYLSELARSRTLTKLNLVHLVRFALHPTQHGSPEMAAALVIFQALAKELGSEPSAFVVAHQIDREAVAAAFMAIRENEAEEIRAAANRVYASLFSRELRPLRLVAR